MESSCVVACGRFQSGNRIPCNMETLSKALEKHQVPENLHSLFPSTSPHPNNTIRQMERCLKEAFKEEELKIQLKIKSSDIEEGVFFDIHVEGDTENGTYSLSKDIFGVCIYFNEDGTISQIICSGEFAKLIRKAISKSETEYNSSAFSNKYNQLANKLRLVEFGTGKFVWNPSDVELVKMWLDVVRDAGQNHARYLEVNSDSSNLRVGIEDELSGMIEEMLNLDLTSLDEKDRVRKLAKLEDYLEMIEKVEEQLNTSFEVARSAREKAIDVFNSTNKEKVEFICITEKGKGEVQVLKDQDEDWEGWENDVIKALFPILNILSEQDQKMDDQFYDIEGFELALEHGFISLQTKEV